MPQNWTSWTAAAAAAFVAVYLAYAAFSSPPVPVDTTPASIGRLEVTIDEEATTRIRDVFTVSVPITGRLQRTTLSVGDPVVAGETVVAMIRPQTPQLLDDRSRQIAEARLHAAEAALGLSMASIKRVEAELSFARSDLKRAQRLFERKTIAERRFEEAQLRVATLMASLETARADVAVKTQDIESARAQLIEPEASFGKTDAECCLTVTAPVDGRVLRILVESEQILTAGTPVIKIGDPANLEVVAELLSDDAVRVPDGARARVERWGGERVLEAKVRTIEPLGFEQVSALGIEEQRVQALLDFTSNPEQYRRLGHQYRVYLRIIVWEANKVLRVPTSALFREGDDWSVFAVEDGVARLKRIKLGRRNADQAQILEGLDPQTRVITHPSDRISDGTTVVERALLQ